MEDGQVEPSRDQGPAPADTSSPGKDLHTLPPVDGPQPPATDQGVPPPPDQYVRPQVDQYVPPFDTGLPPCPAGFTRCFGVCVDLSQDANNCGTCGASCGGGHCLSGLCCPKTHDKCGGACADLQNNPKNCGTCGKTCKASETCKAGACKGTTTSPCADSSVEQTFNKGMVGCAGKEEWSKRATLCGTGYRVCKAAEWVDRRGNKTPSYNYWTNEELRYGGYGTGYCYATETGGKKCNSGTPMRVCVNSNWGYDSLGNHCSWYRCGYKKTNPNHYFGGCNGNKTAGAICCPK